MDANRTDLLGELARDAALERSDFLVRSAEQLQGFLEANAARIKEIGGMTLIDDDPDYLSVAPDLSFRSRTRFQDEATDEWVSETEVIESAAELVELYNPADIYAAFAEAAREVAGLEPEPTAADDLLNVAGIGPERRSRRRPTSRTPRPPMIGRPASRSTPTTRRRLRTSFTTSRSRSRSGASCPRPA